MPTPVAVRARIAEDARDRGSVMPLVVGMVVCLLLLGAAVTAATSAFLGHQRIQNACDGAAASSADVALGSYYAGSASGEVRAVAETAARAYLDRRHATMRIHASATVDAIHLTCTDDVDVTMGALFGVSSLRESADAVGRATD